MSAYVEAMFSVKERPWHGLGVILDEPPSTADAIRQAGLDWKVKKIPIVTNYQTNGIWEKIPVKNRYAVARMGKFGNIVKVFDNVVTHNYKPLQNIEAFKFFDDILKEFPGVTLETAGSLKNGEVVWIMAKLSDEMIVGQTKDGKNDVVEKYLLLSNAHSGKRQVKVSFTPIRVVCWNTLSCAETDVDVQIRHTGNVLKKLESIKYDFMEVMETYEKIGRLFNKMAEAEISADTASMLIRNFVPRPRPNKDGVITERSIRYRSHQIETIHENYSHESDTAWGLYNAVTGYVDYDMRARKDADKRLNSIWFATGAQRKREFLNEVIQHTNIALNYNEYLRR